MEIKGCFFYFAFIINVLVRGFIKLKKIKNSEKNLEVGGWVKPQLGFSFFGEILCFFFFFFFLHVSKTKLKRDMQVDRRGLTNPSFSRIFDLFNLTRPLISSIGFI